MLHLIPAPLHRLLYRLADRARRAWWRMRKPRRRSVMVVLRDESGRVLLARHSYGPRVWTVPGGGIGRNEAPEQAARRELREELACELADAKLVTTMISADSGSEDKRFLFAARAVSAPRADMREIIEIAWFEPEKLPANTSKAARTAVRHVSEQQ